MAPADRPDPTVAEPAADDAHTYTLDADDAADINRARNGRGFVAAAGDRHPAVKTYENDGTLDVTTDAGTKTVPATIEHFTVFLPGMEYYAQRVTAKAGA